MMNKLILCITAVLVLLAGKVSVAASMPYTVKTVSSSIVTDLIFRNTDGDDDDGSSLVCPAGYDYDDDDGYGDDDDGDGRVDCVPVECPAGFIYDNDDGDNDDGFDDDDDGYGDDDDGDGAKDCLPTDPTPGSCNPIVDAVFSADGKSVTVSSSKGLSNVVIEFTDGTTQKIEFGEGDDDDDDDSEIYQITLSGTGVNAGKTISGVYIKSGCNASQPGLGEYVAACNSVFLVTAGQDQEITVPLTSPEVLNFIISLDQPISEAGCSVSISYSTSDITAKAGSEYLPVQNSVVFGLNDQIITVPVTILTLTNANYPVEFSLDLDAVEGANVTDAQAVGTIRPIEF
ncbi:MAG: hypothetical protein KTR16_07820 [Acidiferrobacterales bacterium]|nr:hypothetical protein [Acidiferrobacterales bacterium]